MKILIYDDNPDFGGHQVMACHGISALTADSNIEVIILLNPANQELAKRLPDLGNLQTLEAPHDIHTLEKLFHTLNPDRILCIQGDIKQSSRAIRVATQVDIECISYLALPHTLADMGAKLGALRDHRPIPRPTRYIVISESMKQLLLDRGTTQPITVISNAIVPPQESHKPHASRRTLGLFGRIEFTQKRQDFMVQTFLNNPDPFKDYHLLIVGNGPDEPKLRTLIFDHKNITLLPWPADPKTIYDQIDILVIPSRYEGVPLVMLEALARGIPALGSARDGMRDLLPEEWTFEPDNARSLVKTFSKVIKSESQEIDSLKKMILKDHSLEAFQTNFHRAVTGQ